MNCDGTCHYLLRVILALSSRRINRSVELIEINAKSKYWFLVASAEMGLCTIEEGAIPLR